MRGRTSEQHPARWGLRGARAAGRHGLLSFLSSPLVCASVPTCPSLDLFLLQSQSASALSSLSFSLPWDLWVSTSSSVSLFVSLDSVFVSQTQSMMVWEGFKSRAGGMNSPEW